MSTGKDTNASNLRAMTSKRARAAAKAYSKQQAGLEFLKVERPVLNWGGRGARQVRRINGAQS